MCARKSGAHGTHSRHRMSKQRVPYFAMRVLGLGLQTFRSREMLNSFRRCLWPELALNQKLSGGATAE